MARRLILVLALVVAACGGDPAPTSSPASAAPASVAPNGAVATPAIPAPDETAAAGPAVTPEPTPVPAGSPGASPGPGTAVTDISSGALIIVPDTVPDPDAGVDTPCSAEGTARSTSDIGPSSYSIANATQLSYTVYWLDAEGGRQHWFSLTPGASNTQRTYESHAWLVADAQDRCLGIFHAPADLTIQPSPGAQPTSGPAFPTAAPAGQAGSTTDEAAGRATMLTQSDLPVGAVGDGARVVREESEDFTGNDGLRALTQKWESDGEIHTLFDDRWQFATAAGATAFLTAQEGELSLQSVGLTRQTGIEPAGPGGVVYAARLETAAGTVQSYINFLFRDGNFVARVFVAGTEDMDAGRAVEIARAAAGRVAQVTGSTNTGAFPNAGEAALLAHVPAAIRAGCDRDPAPPEVADASMVCVMQGAGAAGAKYVQLPDNTTLAMVFEARVAEFGDASTGQSCRVGPANVPWSINGTKYGNVFCYVLEGGAWIEWTDERFGIYVLALQPTPNWPALYDWWANEAGPE